MDTRNDNQIVKSKSEDEYRHVLEQTVAAEEFTGDAIRHRIQDTALGATRLPRIFGPNKYEGDTSSAGGAPGENNHPEDTHFNQTATFPGELLQDASSGDRFDVLGMIGTGATARVYAVRDNGLNRTVAVKVLRTTREERKNSTDRFVHEARVTARLEHPNIMPVYDIGATDKDQFYFIMRNMKGVSLGHAIRAAKKGEPVPRECASTDGVVRIFLKICDAMSYAHNNGYIHQDIKPDNVVIGDFGEVMVLDWGCALSRTSAAPADPRAGMFGTPAYMSPEQARTERADERSDVYCVGSSLFHALVGRHTIQASAPDEFWEKKRAGIVDPLSAEEQQKAPRVLLDIAMKAMQADPAARYQTMAHLGDDLKRYQAGLSVKAHRDTLTEKIVRYMRRHRKTILVISIPSLIVLLAGSLLFREKIKELVTWRMIYADRFAQQTTASLAKDWIPYSSVNWVDMVRDSFTDSPYWVIDSGALASREGPAIVNITFRHVVPGDIRAEWDVVDFRENMNLNAYIGGENRTGGYTFHIGAHGNSKAYQLTKGKSLVFLDQYDDPVGIRQGKTYHLRMEKEGEWIRFFINGRRIFNYHDLNMFSGPGHQTFGFETNNGNVIRIRNVRVFHHPLPLKVSPLVTAEKLYERGHFEDALYQYRGLYDAYPKTDVAIRARFNMGRCFVALGALDSARMLFDEVVRRHPRHEIAPLALNELIGVVTKTGSGTDEIEPYHTRLAEEYPHHPVLRAVFEGLTNTSLRGLDSLIPAWVLDTAGLKQGMQWIDSQRAFLQKWGKRFGIGLRPNTFLMTATSAFTGHIGWSVPVVEKKYPDQHEFIAARMNVLGDFEGVVQRHSDIPSQASAALIGLHRYEEVLAKYPEERRYCMQALLALGRYEEVNDPRYPVECAEALYAQGRFRECLELFPAQTDQALPASLATGSFDTFAASLSEDPAALGLVMGLRLFRPDNAYRLFTAARPTAYGTMLDIMQAQMLVDMGRPQEALERIGMQRRSPWAISNSLLFMGRTEEVFRRYGWDWNMACNAYLERGEYDSIAAVFPDASSSIIQALYEKGDLDAVTRWFPRRTAEGAGALLAAGKFEEVLAKFPQERDSCIRALIALKRYDDLLRLFPRARKGCATALIGLGRLDEAMRIFPESRDLFTNALLKQGDYARVISDFPDQAYQYTQALLATGRYDEIPYGKGTFRISNTAWFDVVGVRAINQHTVGDTRVCDSLLNSTRIFYYRSTDGWHEQRFNRFMLLAVIKALKGDGRMLVGACGDIRKNHRYHCAQQLWYEGGFLQDSISTDEFMNQPRGRHVKSRLAFFVALKADLKRAPQTALDGYMECQNLPEWESDEMLKTLTMRRFLEWRIGELGGRVKK